ncbi:MAG: spore coat protein GerQ [Bacilli bacterium]
MTYFSNQNAQMPNGVSPYANANANPNMNTGVSPQSYAMPNQHVQPNYGANANANMSPYATNPNVAPLATANVQPAYAAQNEMAPQGMLNVQLPPQQPIQAVSPMQQIKQQLNYTQGMLPLEVSFVENILRMNKGKIATIYMSFPNSDQWQAKIFKGVIEAAGRDHIIISDPNVGTRYLLLTIYLDYITFDEEINYYYPL